MYYYYTNSGALLPETVALINAMTTKPNGGRMQLINNTISALKNAGLWGSKVFALHMFAAHASDAGILNWINPIAGQSAVLVNSPAFTVDRGYAGDGVSSHLITQIAPNSYTGYTINDAGFSLYINAAGNTVPVLGSSTTLRNFLNPRNSSNVLSARISGANTFTPVATNSVNIGLYTVTRTGANDVQIYKDGVLFEATAANASTAIDSDTTFILRQGSQYSTRRAAFYAVHNGMNASDVLTFNGIINNFLSAIGGA